MPPRASRVLKSTMILSSLAQAGALDFMVSPISISPLQTLSISWTPPPGVDNLNSLALSINCDTMDVPLLYPENVQTITSLFQFLIPDIYPQFQLPTQCSLLADVNSEPPDLLETIPTATFTILNSLSDPTVISTTDPTDASSPVTSQGSPTTPEPNSRSSASESTPFSSTSPPVKNSTATSVTVKGNPATSSNSSLGSASKSALSVATRSMDAPSSPSDPIVIISPTATTSESTRTSTSNHTETTSESTRTSTTPPGLIIGGVVGGLIGLGILIIPFIICFRRRHTPSHPFSTPVPLPYDPDYIQPLDKSQLPQINSKREAAQRQHDQLQETISLRENAHNGVGLNDTPPGSRQLEQQMEAVRQRVLELAAQQRDLANQLYGEQPPPTYSNSSSTL
ncbi:hypothetical protein H2248_010129 [Termitomyces sp. 'cryptogamus']|nr:hypothetical protein H2248_010129 [Termitomyces sp. 'cryptogamus']